MSTIDRRGFLGTSLGGLAAALALDPTACLQNAVFGQDAKAVKANEGGPSTLFLTWRKDPTTTMLVQWIGPEAAAGESIQYQPAEGGIWQQAKTLTKPYPDTMLKVHRAEITGLKPGTEYVFQIGGVARTYSFRTMPAKATDTIQFVSGGDAGVDAHAIGSNILAAKQEPYFALICGDLAYDNGRAPDVFIKFLENYNKHMIDPKGRLIPLIGGIGNHEVNGAYKQTRDKSPAYLSVFDAMYSEKTYGVLDIGDYMSLVILDTDHIAPIGGEQTSWLATTLAERQERPHLIVANHVPAYPSYRAPGNPDDDKLGTGEEQRKNWSPLFERYNVDVVLEHHDHTFKRTHPLKDGLKDKYGVIYLGDGSWGKLRVPKKPEDRPYLATVSGAYHVTLHRLEGEQRFHLAMEESGKIADVCMTTSKRPARRG